MRRYPRATRISPLALLPLLLLLFSFAYLTLSTAFVPLAAPPASDTLPPSPPLPEIMIEPSLPYLLYSATGSPPTAADRYDVLYAAPPSNEETAPPPSLPEGAFPILDKNLSPGPTLSLRNETAFSPDLNRLLSETWKGELPVFGQSQEDPIVLIYHAHGTEAYASAGAAYATEEDSFRSSNIEENVVAVGEQMAQILRQNGIPTLHCTIMHDAESYADAYENARQTVIQALNAYPSIRYILDVHRDSIVTTDGEHIRPITHLEDSTRAAQIMLVIGTNEGGANHPNWETNLALACKLTSRIASRYPHLMRPINLRTSSFLGQYASGAMLVEVGSAANSLAEAKAAATVFAAHLAAQIKSDVSA